MYILHIAYLNDILGGVNTVVPMYAAEQNKYENAELINVRGRSKEELEGFDFRSDRYGVPDIIVFHEVYRIQYIALYKKAKKQGIPYVIVPHGCLTRVSQSKKRLKKICGNILFFNGFINGAVALQCLSQNEYDNTDAGVKKIISTNGISVPAVKESFAGGSPKLVYIGRLEVEIKGIDLMLDAVRMCKDDIKKAGARLDIYGPDDNGVHREIDSMINARGLGDTVALHGAVTGEEKSDILTGSDIFIQTSRTEGMSMGFLEALAVGLVIIATDGVGMSGLMKRYNAGFTAKCDAADISSAIKRALVCKNDYPQMGRNARVLVRENYSWDVIAPKCIEIYRGLINNSSD